MRHQLKYVMMCSLPSITCVDTTPIMLSSTAMYSQNRILALGAFTTGGEDKYFLSYKKHIVVEGPDRRPERR
jgi:hypothetical protein